MNWGIQLKDLTRLPCAEFSSSQEEARKGVPLERSLLCRGVRDRKAFPAARVSPEDSLGESGVGARRNLRADRQ